MTSFLATDNYSPFIVLLIGIATFIGLLGIGLLFLHIARLKMPSPWRQVVGVLLGIQILSLTVQIVGMIGIAIPPVLIGIWIILVAVGGLSCYRLAYPLQPPKTQIIPRGWRILPLIIGIVALTVNLLVAIAPSTKIDELHYHMLLPSRIVSDRALNFYQEPLEGAIMPHMHFQIALTPLHSLGFPDAGNVISWSLSLTLVWFGWYLISQSIQESAFGYFCVTPIVVGIYPVVWYVTGGAHAMGDLATASVVVALFTKENLLKQVNYQTYGFICSFLVLAAGTSKITLLPLGAAILCLSIIYLWKYLTTWQEKLNFFLILSLPWLVFYLPLLIWTFLQSGSPYGPILSNLFPESVYRSDLTKEYNYLQDVKVYASDGWRNTFRTTLLGYSPLVWLLTCAIVLAKKISFPKRVSIVALLLFQITIIIFLLTNEARYLGGLQYGIIILFGMNIS
ncbi:MAG: hypothetical protein SAJ37_18610, partial [Oscillatoria sp. PMC 1068.18]|nr:hypothetical protein [Oscillatoria sp. PMC 1068.18]